MSSHWSCDLSQSKYICRESKIRGEFSSEFSLADTGKIAAKKVKSREAVKHRAAKPSSQQEPQEAGKQQSHEARRSIAHQREGTEYPVSGGQELLYSVVNTHPEFSD